MYTSVKGIIQIDLFQSVCATDRIL